MNTVIYYPYITPRPEWLKLAALCWDKVYRLVPPHGWPDDSEATQDLDQALGNLLGTVDIAEYADSIQDQFWTYIDAREEKLKDAQWSSGTSKERETIFNLYESKFPGGEFVEYLQAYGLARVDTEVKEVQIAEWEVGEWEVVEEEYEPEEPRPGSAHEEYIRLREEAWRKQDEAWALKKQTEASARAETLERQAEALRNKAEEIRKQNLVTYSYRDYDNPVISLPKDVALHYLSLCASQAAKDKRRDLVADGMKYTDAVFYDYSVRGEVGTAILEAYLPEDFFSLDPKYIQEFRKEFELKRGEYQKEVQSIVDDFANSTSEGELETLKNRVVEIAKQKVEDTQMTYQRANKRTAIKAIGMTATPPAVFTLIGSALGIGIFGPAGIVAAVSLFGAGVLLDRDEAKSERDKSPWSYVLEAAKL